MSYRNRTPLNGLFLLVFQVWGFGIEICQVDEEKEKEEKKKTPSPVGEMVPLLFCFVPSFKFTRNSQSHPAWRKTHTHTHTVFWGPPFGIPCFDFFRLLKALLGPPAVPFDQLLWVVFPC